MFKDNIDNVKINLHGRVLKSFFVIVRSYASFAVFILSCVSCIYLLIIDTDFLSSSGIFDNAYLHATVCAFAVFENIILFMLYIYLRLKMDIYFCFFEESLDIKISTTHVCEAICVYALKTIKKFFWFLFFLCPVFVVSVFIYCSLLNGVSYILLSLFSASDFILLITGVYSYAVYIQKYELLSYVLIKYKNKNIKMMFDMSEKLMEGNCRKLLRLKIYNFPKKVLCFLILPAVYCLPYCKSIEADFSLQKEKPYLHKKANTAKTVVFYFKPVKET